MAERLWIPQWSSVTEIKESCCISTGLTGSCYMTCPYTVRLACPPSEFLGERPLHHHHLPPTRFKKKMLCVCARNTPSKPVLPGDVEAVPQSCSRKTGANICHVRPTHQPCYVCRETPGDVRALRDMFIKQKTVGKQAPSATFSSSFSLF